MEYRHVIKFWSLLLLTLVLLACSSESENTSIVYEPINGGEVFEPTVTWPLSEQQMSDVLPLNGFSLRLMEQLWSDGDCSIVASPLSLAFALSMVNEGAVGATRDEITTALGYEAGQHQKLTDLCASLLEGMTLSDDSMQLEIANACCVNQSYGLYSEFHRVMSEYYKAEVSAMDFGNPASVAAHYNAWCNEKTHGQIPWILSADDINEDSDIVLWLNAIYYKGLWKYPFAPEDTYQDVFHALSSSETVTKTVPMMHQQQKFNYLYTDDFAAIELPACGDRFSMTLVLPHSANGLGELLGSMDREMIANIHERVQPTELVVSIPRFTCDSSLENELMQALKVLGIKFAFDIGQAQLPNISPDANLYITLIRQKARIDVTEEGAEASAATVVKAEKYGISASIPSFVADHPFLYYISDCQTGLIVFIGVYNG